MSPQDDRRPERNQADDRGRTAHDAANADRPDAPRIPMPNEEGSSSPFREASEAPPAPQPQGDGDERGR